LPLNRPRHDLPCSTRTSRSHRRRIYLQEPGLRSGQRPHPLPDRGRRRTTELLRARVSCEAKLSRPQTDRCSYVCQ